MTHPNFEDDIKPIFSNFVDCMLFVNLSDDNGVAPLDLSNYDSVVRFHHKVQIAIHGHEEGSNAPHPMPRRGPLPPANIELFDEWVAIGMPKDAGIAAD